MKNIIRLYILAFFLISDFRLFAQPTNEDPDGGNIEGDGDATPGAPINGKLVMLLILGIVFAFYSFKKNRKAIS